MLLSIIIPTKNRQYTALYAIRSALAIESHDIEVIVQDCSDTPILETDIQRNFGTDKRIKYSYSSSNPSMTENWNHAFARATGHYCCGIGDDDAVLPEIYKVAKWAKENGSDAIVHSLAYNYAWPGFYLQPLNGTFFIKGEITGKVIVKKDYDARVRKYASLTNLSDYFDLPGVYHAILSKKIINQLISDTGNLLFSTSLDVYTAIAFNKYIQEYIYVDYPFTLKGASANSNSQRAFTENARSHFAEFKQLNLPELLPDAGTLHVSIAEALIVASEKTQQQYLLKLIDLPLLYANIALEDNLAYDACVEKLSLYKPGLPARKRFNAIFRQGMRAKRKRNFIESVKKWAPYSQTVYRALSPRNKTMLTQQATTIAEALELHKTYIAKRNVELQFPAFAKNKKDSTNDI